MPLATYPYLGFSLLLLTLAALCLLGWRGQRGGRRAQLLLACAGLGCAPFGLFSFMYIPKYWDPVFIYWFGPAGPEDIIFAIGTAALAMCIALAPFSRSFALPPVDWLAFFRRYLTFCALGIGFGYGLIYALLWGLDYRIDTMLACLVSIALSAGLVFTRRPDLLRLCAPGLLFPLFYWLMLRASFLLWPAFLHSWDAPEQDLGWLAGVPLYELLWALGLGTVWPPFIAWCAGLRLTGGGEASGD